MNNYENMSNDFIKKWFTTFFSRKKMSITDVDFIIDTVYGQKHLLTFLNGIEQTNQQAKQKDKSLMNLVFNIREQLYESPKITLKQEEYLLFSVVLYSQKVLHNELLIDINKEIIQLENNKRKSINYIKKLNIFCQIIDYCFVFSLEYLIYQLQKIVCNIKKIFINRRQKNILYLLKLFKN